MGEWSFLVFALPWPLSSTTATIRDVVLSPSTLSPLSSRGLPTECRVTALQVILRGCVTMEGDWSSDLCAGDDVEPWLVQNAHLLARCDASNERTRAHLAPIAGCYHTHAQARSYLFYRLSIGPSSSNKQKLFYSTRKTRKLLAG